MKIRNLALSALFLFVLASCEKDNLPDGRFIGIWISKEKADTLYFIDDHTFKTPRNDRVLHTFSYSYTEDSITIQYTGPNMVLTRPTTHHYEIRNSILTFDFHDVKYGFEPLVMVYNKHN